MPKPKKKEGQKKGKRKRRLPVPVLMLIPLILILFGILYINLKGENGAVSSPSPSASFGLAGPAWGGAPDVKIGRVFLSPIPLLSENDVTARVEGGEPGSGSFQWERNGVIVPFVNSGILPKNQYKKGDRIRATFLTSGGKEGISSEEIRVENTPPQIVKAVIEPVHPNRRSILSVKLNTDDVDGDPVTYTYRWFKEDGSTVNTKASIPAALFSRNEKVNVEILPSDGEAEGKGVIATEVIVNSPPKITSIPVPFSGNEYIYQVTAESPDQEPLLFTLEKSPSGMTIDSKTGLVKWSFTDKDAGVHRVEIRVSDPGGGEGTQSFDLPLSFSTTPVSSLSGMEGRIENQ